MTPDPQPPGRLRLLRSAPWWLGALAIAVAAGVGTWEVGRVARRNAVDAVHRGPTMPSGWCTLEESPVRSETPKVRLGHLYLTLWFSEYDPSPPSGFDEQVLGAQPNASEVGHALRAHGWTGWSCHNLDLPTMRRVLQQFSAIVKTSQPELVTVFVAAHGRGDRSASPEVGSTSVLTSDWQRIDVGEIVRRVVTSAAPRPRVANRFFTLSPSAKRASAFVFLLDVCRDNVLLGSPRVDRPSVGAGVFLAYSTRFGRSATVHRYRPTQFVRAVTSAADRLRSGGLERFSDDVASTMTTAPQEPDFDFWPVRRRNDGSPASPQAGPPEPG